MTDDTVKAFCAALKDRFNDPASGLGRAYVRLLVDEVRLIGTELTVTGSHQRLVDAIGFMQKKKLGEVPSFVRDWRPHGEQSESPPFVWCGESRQHKGRKVGSSRAFAHCAL